MYDLLGPENRMARQRFITVPTTGRQALWRLHIHDTVQIGLHDRQAK